ncbi:hypothetical protein POM88_017445 [Heracleum sosnowskyi]|uniref:Protein kinase domain-containing protein n=1 Tax=Heracleum sosnowskyi TaxID=360622 RepID=A0AAD8MYB8_9APIA|nr:hypothetical protein POM88_017445 [Heracleum sosnowskyi]
MMKNVGQKFITVTGFLIDNNEVSNIQNITLYSYKELQTACGNFGAVNKIGMGGFGSVYKGKLKDGTLVAVKVLSEESTQGIQEFLTEITTISAIEHENLVKLYGCCVEGIHRILVYGFLENNSIAQTLLGLNHRNIQFSWNIRREICIGVARGLAYLHEEIQPHIVHRDIKASNILLDENLTAKISDFGLAKLFPPNMSHISTRVAGTLGYLAPEYALRRQLTRKADIYSFGVLLLEIVCGRCNKSEQSLTTTEEDSLLEKAWDLYNRGELVELIDASLEREDIIKDEAVKYITICFVCTQEMPKLRPLMSTVVKMLTGETEVQVKLIAKPGILSEAFQRRNNTEDASSPAYFRDEGSSINDSTIITLHSLLFSSLISYKHTLGFPTQLQTQGFNEIDRRTYYSTGVMRCFSACFGKKTASSSKQAIDIEEEVSSIQNIKLYPYKELQIATSYFSAANKIGEGGFGSVYKGKLKDGTLVAVKVLSAESRQGVREFLTELVTISDLDHENLVEIYGCCVEGVHRILVYGYLQNNSLAQTLLGDGHCTIEFSWKRRTEICIGIARGLSYLHELVPAHLSHISTQVAGTLGYLAPEYAIRGQLTRKADVYSLGILLLEIVCGRRNRDSRLPSKEKFLLELAWELYKERDIMGLVDASLNGNFSINEASRCIKIAFLCTQDDPKSRPSMSTIVNMLKGDIDVDEMKISKPGLLSELSRTYKSTPNESSTRLGKPDDVFLSFNETMSYGTMTFTSIEDGRS